MDQQLAQLHAFLDRLVRRERRLLAGQAGLQAASVAVGCTVLAAILVSLGVGRAALQGWVGGLGAVAVVLALAWPAALRWVRAGDRHHQARLVESLVPALRSRLLTALDRVPLFAPDEALPKPAPRGVSRALLDRATRRAVELVRPVRPVEVHDARPVRRVFGALLGAGFLAVIAGAVLPVGPMEAVGVLMGGSAARARIESGVAEVAAERAVVGDIVLRYVFPDYTGMEPLEVPNSDGTIHAPPGTTVQITARTELGYQAAALEVVLDGDEEANTEDAGLVGGRDLSTSLVVRRDGVWRFVLFNGNEVTRSRDYRIVAEVDSPPVVALERARDGAVPVDQRLAIGWSVKDDYGLRRVVLEVLRKGSDEVQEFELRAPLDAPSDLRGGVRLSPRDLGLKPGDEATLKVVAYDNDLLGGTQRGESQELHIQVVGPRSGGERLAAYHRKLRDAMIPALADFLVEATPPADSSQGMVRWVDRSRVRFEPIQEVYEAQWGNENPDGIDATLVQRVLENSARLFRFTLTAWDPSTTQRVTDQDLETFRTLHGEEVAALEQAIFVIDSMLRQAALRDLVEQADHVAQMAGKLADTPENTEAGELLARLDQLERLLRQLAQSASQLSEGQLSEFVNSRVEETMNLMDEIRKAIAEGRVDDARKMLDQLALQLQQLAEGVGEQLSGQQEGEDNLRKAYEQALQDLEQLETSQRELADKLAQEQEKLGPDLERQMAAWNRLDELARKAATRAQGAASAAGDGRGWRVGTIRRLERVRGGADDVSDAVRARDPDGALERLYAAALPLEIARTQVQQEGTRPRIAQEPVPPGVGPSALALQDVASAYDEMQRILEQLSQTRGEPPELQQKAQELSGQQLALKDQAEQLAKDVETIERAMPTADGSATKAMERAGDSMERAGSSLQQGQALPAEGHQRDAADQVGEARRQLEREMGEMEQMQQSMQRMRQSGQGQSGGGDEQESAEEDPMNRVEIPAPEEFQTPEEYRRALLEGMEADVPEQYRALKKRYYEELVRQ